MTFESLYNLFFENLRGNEVFRKDRRSLRTIPNISNAPIQTSEELINRIGVLLNKSVILDLNKLTSDETWSTMLFRGHKVLNPFSKTGDSKAVGDKVYWSKNPDTALIYALNQSSWGTSGQQYINVIQRALNETGNSNFNDGSQQTFEFGYLTIAQPKNPQTLKWYRNFGVEDEERQRQEAIRDAKQKHMEQNPNKLFTGLPADYKPLNTYGYNKDQLDAEHQRQSELFKRYGETKTPKALDNNPETALSPNEVQKVRTYLVWNKNRMLSTETIKKYDPVLYNVLLKDSL